MTSNDNNIYIREDVFNARMEKLEAIIERNLAITRADIAEFKADIKADVAAVRSELKAEIADVRSELKAEIAGVKSELKAEIADVRSEVRVQSSRIDSLVHWNYWIIALFIAFFMMPSVIEGIRAVFSALTQGIASFFKRKKSD